MTTRDISVTLPVGQAIERTRRILFQPFDLGKWFTIGFCAWLASLGQGGVNGGVNFHGPAGGRTNPPNVQHWFEQARDYVVQNLWWLLPVVVAVVLVGLAIAVTIIWLSSRGEFMFLHCVALDKAEVRAPWHEFVREGNSLFVFRLVFSFGGFVLFVPLVAGIGFLIALMVQHRTANAEGILAVVALGIMAILLSLVWWIVARLTRDFVVPIQFSRRLRCLQGWRVFRDLLLANPGPFILYFLFQILIAIAIFAIVLMVVLVTCCVAGCLLAIPYIGTVLLLPVLVFRRAYSILYLAQYGSDYNVISGSVPA